jgi:hypothetical protein
LRFFRAFFSGAAPSGPFLALLRVPVACLRILSRVVGAAPPTAPLAPAGIAGAGSASCGAGSARSGTPVAGGCTTGAVSARSGTASDLPLPKMKSKHLMATVELPPPSSVAAVLAAAPFPDLFFLRCLFVDLVGIKSFRVRCWMERSSKRLAMGGSHS